MTGLTFNFGIPDLSDIPEAALAIHGELVRRQVEGIVPTHMDEKGMAAHLGITRGEVRDHCALLTAHGLIHKATDGLTEGQLRVLYALPDWDPANPTAGVTNRQLAERLGMDVQEVKQHMRVLDDLGWTKTPPEDQRHDHQVLGQRGEPHHRRRHEDFPAHVGQLPPQSCTDSKHHHHRDRKHHDQHR